MHIHRASLATSSNWFDVYVHRKQAQISNGKFIRRMKNDKSIRRMKNDKFIRRTKYDIQW